MPALAVVVDVGAQLGAASSSAALREPGGLGVVFARLGYGDATASLLASSQGLCLKLR